MWHKPCRTFHPWCPCIKTRCLSTHEWRFWRFIFGVLWHYIWQLTALATTSGKACHACAAGFPRRAAILADWTPAALHTAEPTSHVIAPVSTTMATEFVYCQICPQKVFAVDVLTPTQSTSLWRHQMKTLSALLNPCEGNPPVTGGLYSQEPVTQSLDVFFDLRMNKRLKKQLRCRWFETPLRSLWRQYNNRMTNRMATILQTTFLYAFFSNRKFVV